jgi:hypothetical protein
MLTGNAYADVAVNGGAYAPLQAGVVVWEQDLSAAAAALRQVLHMDST